MTQEWEEYREKVYPEGFGSALQAIQIHQAFFAGAFCAFAAIYAVNQLPEDAGVVELQAIKQEIMDTCEKLCDASAGRGGKN